ncbi:hypothetical protein ACDP63_22315 [Paracoccus sp. P2]|nr:hypothetical protein [Paracoccus pantotrophus]MDF3856439.1 hypothetical protein [Paracoccus pantotrophus]
MAAFAVATMLTCACAWWRMTLIAAMVATGILLVTPALSHP